MQVPARWPTIQAVISPGDKAPLPAEIRHLNHPIKDEREKFHYMSDDIYSSKNTDETSPGFIGPTKEERRDPKTQVLRQFLQHVIVLVWRDMKLEKLAGNEFCSYRWSAPTETVKAQQLELIEIVMSLSRYDSVRDRLHAYGSDYIAELAVNLGETLRVNKNWNSQAATVGATLCSMAVMLADEQKVDEHQVPQVPVSKLKGFRILRPAAKVLTGGCYGSKYNVNIEYMTAEMCTSKDGSSFNYLTDHRFRACKHGDFIKKRFAQKIKSEESDEDDYFIPRPTKATTADFTVTYQGVEVLHGECKRAECVRAEHAAGAWKACFCASQQLAFNKKGLVLHTSGSYFRIYKLFEDETEYKVNMAEVQPYNLEQQSLHRPTPKSFPPFHGLPTVEDFHERDREKNHVSKLQESWEQLEIQQRGFLRAVFDCVDLLAWEFENTDFDQVLDSYKSAYDRKLFSEPCYWQPTSSNTDVPVTRTIQNQEMFRYGPSLMGRMSLEKMLRNEHLEAMKDSVRTLVKKVEAGRGNEETDAVMQHITELIIHEIQQPEGAQELFDDDDLD